jgi:hypothetical protein
MVLIEVASGPKPARKPIYRRAGYNLVTYDGDPQQVIEPRNVCSLADATTDGGNASSPTTSDRIVGIEYIKARRFEAQAYYDNIDVNSMF